MNSKQMFEQENFESINVDDNGVMDIPESTVRLLLLSEYGKVPKKKRLKYKRLKKVVHKAIVRGLGESGVDIGDKLRRKYL